MALPIVAGLRSTYDTMRFAETLSADTIYICTDTGDLFYGDVPLGKDDLSGYQPITDNGQDAYSGFLAAFFDESADPLMETLPAWRKTLIATLPQHRLIRFSVSSTFGGLSTMSAAVKALLGGTYGYVEAYNRSGKFMLRFVPIYTNFSNRIVSTAFVWNQPNSGGSGAWVGFFQNVMYTGVVADDFYSYAATEKPTGGTWTDGKPIYKQTFTGTLGQTDGETSALATITGMASFIKKEQTVRIGTKVYDGWTVPEASTANTFNIGIDESTGAITTYWTGYSSYAGATVTVTLYYTKA